MISPTVIVISPQKGVCTVCGYEAPDYVAAPTLAGKRFLTNENVFIPGWFSPDGDNKAVLLF